MELGHPPVSYQMMNKGANLLHARLYSYLESQLRPSVQLSKCGHVISLSASSPTTLSSSPLSQRYPPPLTRRPVPLKLLWQTTTWFKIRELLWFKKFWTMEEFIKQGWQGLLSLLDNYFSILLPISCNRDLIVLAQCKLWIDGRHWLKGSLTSSEKIQLYLGGELLSSSVTSTSSSSLRNLGDQRPTPPVLDLKREFKQQALFRTRYDYAVHYA